MEIDIVIRSIIYVYDVFYSPTSHQYVQGDTSIITRLQMVQMLCCVTDTTIKVQMLCCVADTPSQLKIIIISLENV
jgi:hypothetical protein